MPNLISVKHIDGTSGTIYVHSGISATISSSFGTPSGESAGGMTIDGSANLITGNYASTSVFVHSGISSTITSSFANNSAAVGLSVDSSGNLIRTEYSNNAIYKHSGITSTVTASWPSGLSGTNTHGNTLDSSGNLIIASDIPKIIIYSGISGTITNSFAGPGTATNGVTLDGSGNLVSCDWGVAKIYIHSGITNTITSSFSSPGGTALMRDLTTDTVGAGC